VFDTLAQVRDSSKNLIQEVVTKQSMPFGSAPKPSQEQRNQFREWLACGAAE
jgi:uncharacterized membrane protein